MITRSIWITLPLCGNKCDYAGHVLILGANVTEVIDVNGTLISSYTQFEYTSAVLPEVRAYTIVFTKYKRQL